MRIRDKNRVRVIGKLIRIYREEKRQNTQNEYTLVKFCEGICTINTLKRIESGECSRSDEVYDELLAKLQLRFDHFPEVDTAVAMLMEPLYHAIEYYQIEHVIACCDKALRLLDKVKDYVYYAELYDLFQATKIYYEQDIEISVDKMEHYQSIYALFSIIYQDLFKRLIFTRACMETVVNFTHFKEVIKNLELMKSQYLSTKSLMMYYFYITRQYFELRDIILFLEDSYHETNNYCRLLDVYSYAFLMYSEIDCEKRNTYIEKVDHLVNTYPIPDIKIAEIYSNIASGLHNEGKYETALKYFESMLQYSKDVYLPHIIYIAHCQRHLNKRIDIPQIDKKVLEKNSKALQLMYSYYQNFYTIDIAVRQNFLVKEIAPTLNDEQLIHIFRYEMNKTVDENNRYAKLRAFERILEKN